MKIKIINFDVKENRYEGKMMSPSTGKCFVDPFVGCAMEYVSDEEAKKLVGRVIEIPDNTSIYNPFYLVAENELKILEAQDE
jgi:hypothetical protein